MSTDIEPRRIDIQLPAVRLSALDYGPPPGVPDRATTLVLLHGSADLAWSLDPIARAFRHDYHVINVDMRGHGESEHPGAYSTMHYVADLASLVDELRLERPVLVGHSLGGQVISQYAGLFPDVPSAIVLAEGIGPPVAERTMFSDAIQSGLRHVELLRQRLRHKPLANVEAAAQRLLQAHSGLDSDRAHFLASVGTRPGPDGGLVWKFDPRIRHWFAGFDPIAAEVRWHAVRCPTLVVTGDMAWERWWRDAAGGGTFADLPGPDLAEIDRRVACFADAEHVELTGAGHMLPFDAPEALSSVMASFLARRLNG